MDFPSLDRRVTQNRKQEHAKFLSLSLLVALKVFTEECATKPFQCNASQIDAFDGNLQPMDSSRMGQDPFDHANVDAQRYRRDALVRTLALVLDELAAIEMSDLLFAQIALERREGGRLGSWRGGFPTAHISAI